MHVAADRLDAAHLSRLAKFFGYAPVYDAILQVAPIKSQGFAQQSPIVYSAPVVGVASPGVARAARMNMEARGGSSLQSVEQAGAGAAVVVGGTFKPNVSMTLDEIYTGFRGMMIGRTAVTAALYETAAYAGVQLTFAYGVGYGAGTLISNLMQTYAPIWYIDTFVPFVGNGADFVQSFTDTVGSYVGGNLYDLGHYEADMAPSFFVPAAGQLAMQTTGGDAGTTEAWQLFHSSGKLNGCPQNPQIVRPIVGETAAPQLMCTHY